MKRYVHVPNTPDWRTDTDNQEINALRQIMADNAELQDEPYVGIFWYDVNNQELFGVYQVPADEAEYKSRPGLFANRAKTCRPLHEKIWRKARYKKNPDPRFNRDYTQVPRGRVFEVENEGFVVYVGSWIKEYPEAKDLIIDEFELPEDNTKFKIDTHWDLGHGWSE